MSRERILAFARGEEIKRSNIVVYEVEPQTGEIIIKSVEINTSAINAEYIFIRDCDTKEDVETNVTEEALRVAITWYLHKKYKEWVKENIKDEDFEDEELKKLHRQLKELHRQLEIE